MLFAVQDTLLNKGIGKILVEPRACMIALSLLYGNLTMVSGGYKILNVNGIIGFQMENFSEILTRRYGIGKPESEYLISFAEPVTLRKGAALVECGGFNDSFYFLDEGILRAFRSPSDRNLTLWFALPGDIVVDMFCYYDGSVSPIGIEAETDASLFCISKLHIERACGSSLPVANAVRRIFEHHACGFEANILSLWDCDDGRERYLSILKRRPELLKRVPLKKLASYLKMTPQSLSRIRSEMDF